jgi:hypothetical protein
MMSYVHKNTSGLMRLTTPAPVIISKSSRPTFVTTPISVGPVFK